MKKKLKNLSKGSVAGALKTEGDSVQYIKLHGKVNCCPIIFFISNFNQNRNKNILVESGFGEKEKKAGILNSAEQKIAIK